MKAIDEVIEGEETEELSKKNGKDDTGNTYWAQQGKHTLLPLEEKHQYLKQIQNNYNKIKQLEKEVKRQNQKLEELVTKNEKSSKIKLKKERGVLRYRITILREKMKMPAEIILKHHFKLVYKYAYHYINNGVEIEDLIQSGNEGILKAAERYSPRKKTQFTTYAVFWIRQAIQRAIRNDGRTIRIPVNRYDTKGMISKEKLKYRRLYNGDEPTNEEIARRLNIPEEKVKSLAEDPYTISLEKPIMQFFNDNETVTVEDRTEDKHATKNIESSIEHIELNEIIQSALDRISIATRDRDPERTKDVIKRRFGIEPYQLCQTLDDIGKDLDITRERVRQIELKGLRSLRFPLREIALAYGIGVRR